MAGQGLARVRATGAPARLGAIGSTLAARDTRRSGLQRETDRVVRRFAAVGLGLCGVAIVAYGLTRGDWLHAVLAGLTMAIAVLPEEMPVILTVFLALGAWRIARHHVLTRRVPAIEALGAASVLCVDKTGTLTLNQMTVTTLWVDGNVLHLEPGTTQEIPEPLHHSWSTAFLRAARTPSTRWRRRSPELGGARLGETEHLHPDWTLVREYPLSRDCGR